MGGWVAGFEGAVAGLGGCVGGHYGLGVWKAVNGRGVFFGEREREREKDRRFEGIVKIGGGGFIKR